MLPNGEDSRVFRRRTTVFPESKEVEPCQIDLLLIDLDLGEIRVAHQAQVAGNVQRSPHTRACQAPRAEGSCVP